MNNERPLFLSVYLKKREDVGEVAGEGCNVLEGGFKVEEGSRVLFGCV